MTMTDDTTSAYERDLKKMEPLQCAWLMMKKPQVEVRYSPVKLALVIRVRDLAVRGVYENDWPSAAFSPFGWNDNDLLYQFNSGISRMSKRVDAERAYVEAQRKRAKLVRGKRYARAGQALSNAVLRSLTWRPE